MASRAADEFSTLFLRKMVVSMEAEPRRTQGRLGPLPLLSAGQGTAVQSSPTVTVWKAL